MIIAMACTKGGVGKTTAAVHVATMLARRGTTLLIDGDPSGVASQWMAWRSESGWGPSPDVVQMLDEEILDAGDLLDQYEHVVIDVGGWDNPALRASIVVADKVLMPLNVSGFDAIHVAKMVEIFDEARKFNPGLAVRVMPSLVDTRARDHFELRDFVREYGLRTTDSVFFERKPIRTATSAGQVVEELPGDHAAKLMIRKLMREIETSWT